MKLVLITPNDYGIDGQTFFEHQDKFAAQYEIFEHVSEYLAKFPKIIKNVEITSGGPYYEMLYGYKSFVVSGMTLEYKDFITLIEIPPKNTILRVDPTKASYRVTLIEPKIQTLEEYFDSVRTGHRYNTLTSILKDP